MTHLRGSIPGQPGRGKPTTQPPFGAPDVPPPQVGGESPSLSGGRPGRSWIPGIGPCLRAIPALILALAALRTPAHAQSSVAVSWNPSAGSTVAGYRIHFGPAPRSYTRSVDTGTALRGVVTGLEPGTTYYFAVTAYGALGLESDLSAEIAYTTQLAVPPTIAMAAPAGGATFRAPAAIGMAATVEANGHAISSVQFMNGATVLGEDTTAPYAFTWVNVPAGSFYLAARARYGGTLSVTTPYTRVFITNPPPPTITLTSPTEGATFRAPATLSLAATVQANGHTLQRVQFLNGSTLLGDDLTAPYTFTWSNAPAGNPALSARAVYGSGATVTSTQTRVSILGIPQPWQTVDVGTSPSTPGSAVLSNGVFTVTGSGTIGGTADSFRYLHQSLLGPGQITFRLQNAGSSSTGAVFGAMIRESLTPGSRFALLTVAPDGTSRWLTRTNSGGPTLSATVSNTLTNSPWIRLVRVGNTIQGFKSSTGGFWALAQQTTFTLSSNAYWGIAVASGASNTLNTATFSDVTVAP